VVVLNLVVLKLYWKKKLQKSPIQLNQQITIHYLITLVS